MQKYTSLDDIIELARYAHRNQRDKAGLPYFDHPYRVMQSVQAQGAMPYVQMAAILHDVPEDTSFSHDVLWVLGIPDPALRIVRLLDRNESESEFRIRSELKPDYVDYNMLRDEYYYEKIKACPEAKMVKLADIDDNTQEWRLAYLSEKTRDHLRKKYAKAKEILLG